MAWISQGRSIQRRRKHRGSRRRGLLIESLEPRLLLSVSATIPAVILDPVDRLATSRVLGEWNGADLEGWTVNNAQTLSVSGGAVTLTSQNGTANPLQLDLRNIASGPNLDYAFFDYLQIRMQLPVAFSKDVTFSFGTSTHTGFASDRTFTIAASSLAQDGAMHTYRLDLGLVVWWRDTLNDLRVQPLGTTGANETASIDYVEVGDLPNDVLGLNTNLNYAAGVTSATAQHIESKHFAIWWDPAVDPGGRGFDPAVEGLHAIRALEESYQVYCKVLGYDEPFQTMSHTGARMKLNLLTWYSGYWEGGWANYAHMNIDTSGLQDEGVGSPVPHEFGHAIQSNQLGQLAGGHWESDANYLRDQRNLWFAPLFSASTVTSISLNVMTWSNFQQDAHRIIYEDYRIHDALTYYATSLGLPADEAARLWRTGTAGLSAWAKLAALLPSGMSIKDVAGTLLRYWPMLDFPIKANMQAQLWGTAAARAQYDFQTGSPLIAEPDNTGWYQVPFERAPEKYAYMYHNLTPTAGSTSVTVTLRGFNVPNVTDEDWRWSLAAVDGAGNVRYSSVFAPGTQSFALNPGENRVLLIVVATPGSAAEDLDSFYNTKPTDKSADRMRYPYEVQVTGATPTTTPLNLTASAYKSPSLNPDGSPRGLIASTATVAATAYVGVNARVLGTAQVLGTARVEDYAVVAGNARVRDSAVVSGYAEVTDNGIVMNNGRATDHAMITGNSQVQGNALVEQYARIGDSAIVKDWAVVRGDSYIWGSAVFGGFAIADYDYSMNYNLTDGVQDNHIPFDSYFQSYYANTQTKPRGLIASYGADETTGEELQDEFGSLQAWLKGSPTRPTDATMNSQVLQLNGSTQYAVLDRTVANLTDGTMSLWLNPTSSDANETLLYFGSSANTYLKLAGRDTSGLAHLTISVNGTVKELVSTAPVPLNQWTNLAVTFGGGVAAFYINGQAAGSTAMSYRPIDVLGPDDYSAAKAYYLGRDPAGNYFTGKLENVRFYNATLTQAEISNEIARSGARIGAFFATMPQTFDGSTTYFESGVHNATTRTLAAWVKPATNAATYMAVFDAYDQRGGGNNRGSGIGLNGGVIYVRLDGVGLWNTGVAVTLNAWQQIAVTLSGTTANVYLNGVLKATRSYTTSNTAMNYHIGAYQTDTATPATRTGFFNGQIFNAQIFDRVVVPSTLLGGLSAVNDSAIAVMNSGANAIAVLANDSTSSPVQPALKVSAVTQGAHGTVTIPSGGTGVIYTPAANYSGTDSFTYTLSDGFGDTALATVSMTIPSNANYAPSIVNPAAATPNPATTSAALSVLASDSGGEPALAYTWSATSPPAAPVFSINGTNAAKNTNVTFTKAGTYHLQVAVTNVQNFTTVSLVDVIVSQNLTSVAVTPPSSNVGENAVTPLTATARDQFGDPLAVQPPFTWSLISGTGTVDANGHYWSPGTAASATIRAATGAYSATATVSSSLEEIAWYQANASSGTMLADSSGHGKTASLTSTYAWAAGAADNAIKLTGGYATLPTGILSGVTDVTISTWVKIDTLSTWSRIFDFGTGTTVNMFLTPQAVNATGPVRFAITTSGNGAEQQINGTTALPTGVWTHVAITLAGSVGTLYVNGVVAGTNTGMTLHPADMGSTNLNYLGKSQYGDPALLGSIDDFRIYGRALSAAEILRLASPALVLPASASPDPTGGGTALLKVLGADATSGESGLSYRWTTIGTPPAAVGFGANGTNAAKNTTATFTKPGIYNFQVTITDMLGLSVTSTTLVTVTTAVVGRYLFYRNSAFDLGGSDSALAADKTALSPGQTATFANYSNYSRGINGVMMDIAGPVGNLTAADFLFAVGNDNSPDEWAAAPGPTSITLRPGAGAGGSTRVEMAWADNAIANQWLQVTLKGGAGATSGLAADDVFYFGNAIGESGDSTGSARVDANDELMARAHFAAGVLVTNQYDFDRDGQVGPADLTVARSHITFFLNELALIAPPAPAGQSPDLAAMVHLVSSVPAGPVNSETGEAVTPAAALFDLHYPVIAPGTSVAALPAKDRWRVPSVGASLVRVAVVREPAGRRIPAAPSQVAINVPKLRLTVRAGESLFRKGSPLAGGIYVKL